MKLQTNTTLGPVSSWMGDCMQADWYIFYRQTDEEYTLISTAYTEHVLDTIMRHNYM